MTKTQHIERLDARVQELESANRRLRRKLDLATASLAASAAGYHNANIESGDTLSKIQLSCARTLEALEKL